MKKNSQIYENHQKGYEKLQDQNHQYFQEYLRICKITQILSSNIKETKLKQSMVKERIERLSNKIEDIRDPFRKQKPQGKKNIRRVSNQIEKSHVCQIQGCQKRYASDLSLKIHQKLKHAGHIKNQIIDNGFGDLNVDS